MEQGRDISYHNHMWGGYREPMIMEAVYEDEDSRASAK